MQRFGLQTDFANNPSINQLVRRASALPLVRLNDIDDVWLNALEDADLNNPAVLQFTDYVTEVWVDSAGRSTWNHFNSTGPRTNNHVEGWHGRMNKVGHPHPNLFYFIDILKKEQCHTEIVIRQLLQGGKQPPKKKKYRNIDYQLRTEKDLLLAGSKTPVQYADAVSYLVGL